MREAACAVPFATARRARRTNPTTAIAGCASSPSARPLPAWVNFPLDGFAWTAGEPAWYRSSPELRRGFCPTCGTSLCTLADDDAYVCITLASLDDPAQIAPILHMWTSSQAAWLAIDDDLPRHEGQA